MKIGIIGSGPSAVSALAQIAKVSSFEVTLITHNNVSEVDIDRKIPLKSYLDSRAAYALDDFSVFEPKEGVFRGISASKIVGGFSQVWGGSIDFEEHDMLLDDFDGSDWIYESNIKSVRQFRFSIERNPGKFQIIQSPARLALNQSLCVKCGECIMGCKYNAIWNAREIIDGLVPHLAYPIISAKINRVAVGTNVEVFLEDGRTLIFDKLILAAGTLGNIEIMMNSFKEIVDVQISDTATFFFAGIKLRRLVREKWLGLHQYRYAITMNNLKMEVQIYPQVQYLLERATHGKSKISVIFIKKAWRFVSPFLVTGIAYFDPKYSDGLSISRQASPSKYLLDRVENINGFQLSKILKHILLRSIGKFGFIPILQTISNEGVGSGFHFGDAKINLKHFNYCGFNSYLDSIKINQILVIGSTELQDISPGPITSQIMRNARDLVRHFLDLN